MKHFIILVDTSYSMVSHMDKVVSGLNRFVSNLKTQSNMQVIYISVAYFNDQYSYVCKQQNIHEIPIFLAENFNKFGATSLYDAIGGVVEELLTDTSECQHNMFVISDGNDTTSNLHTSHSVETLCQQAIMTGKWTITHCSTDLSNLSTVKKVKYDVDELDDLLSSLSL